MSKIKSSKRYKMRALAEKRLGAPQVCLGTTFGHEATQPHDRIYFNSVSSISASFVKKNVAAARAAGKAHQL